MTQSLTLIRAIRRTACAALLAVAAAGSPAQAAGLFDFLFGGRSPPRPPTYDRLRAAAADPVFADPARLPPALAHRADCPAWTRRPATARRAW